MTALWPHQVNAIDRCRAAARAGHRRILCVMPTGAGKTRTCGEIVRRVVSTGKRALWFAHRSELVDQAAGALAALGLTVGAMCPSAQTPPNPYAQVQVATVQTLLARGQRPPADIIITDEAHHYVADEWSSLFHDYPDTLVIGPTATPERCDGRGLGELFTTLVVGATHKELVASGHLTPCEILGPSKRLGRGEIAQHPVDAYRQHGQGRRAIVFARSVQLAEEYATDFQTHGIVARALSAETPWGERTLYIDAFRAGKIQVLTNVFVLTEGFDAPETSCVIIARGCSTAGTYLQMVGRGIRAASGKKAALLLDLNGISHEFGAPDDGRLFSLDGKGIRLADKAVYCPVCGAERASGEGCEACGWQASHDIDQSAKVTGDPLVKFAGKREESDEQRFATLCKWATVAQAKGYKPGWLYAKWKVVYGVPLSSAEVARAMSAVRGAA